MKHQISCKSLVFLTLLFLQHPALALQDFTVTRGELAMMPPYCTALYGKYVGLPQPQDSPLHGTIPPNCPSLHHYCDGLKAMIRVDYGNSDGRYWLEQAIQSFQSVTSEWERDGQGCSVRPEAYTKLGNALRRQNRFAGPIAITDYKKALQLQKDYLPAYYALSDVYIQLGEKKEALGVVENGLRYYPDSKGLLRRFKQLGGKTPPPPIAANAPPSTAATSQAASGTPQGQTGSTERSSPPSPNASTGSGSPAPGQPSGTPQDTKIGIPGDPYCRFCPPQ
jgi:tetratricopeptide (TPR) repeat protein